MTDDAGPVRALPGDWETLNRSLQRAYATGREHQFYASTHILMAVIRAIGGKVSFTLPGRMDGKLIQEAHADGTVTLEYKESGSDQNERPKEDRPKLSQAWSADDPDRKGANQGSQVPPGDDANGKGESV